MSAKQPLKGRVAIVAGASRGAGKGIALALGEAGATVYALGRTTVNGAKPSDGAPGTIEETADEVSRRGGRGIPVALDCTDTARVEEWFTRFAAEQSQLDVLANAVWGAADGVRSIDEMMAAWGAPFWTQPTAAWHRMMQAGPYAYFLMSVHALRLMTPRKRGLIVGITDNYVEPPPGQPAGDPMAGGQLVWQLAHQCINLLMAGMAHETKKHKIAVVTLMPGFMRTERVLAAMTTEKLKKQFGFEHSETTEYIGRAVAALAADPRAIARSGKIQFVADLAAHYGFTDTDGRTIPRFNPFG